MKQVFALLISILITVSVLAQSPQKMSYQAVIRDASGVLVTEQLVGMQVSILLGATDGPVVYSETQTPTTNANGLVSIEIGTGISGYDFSTVDWANGPYFLKTETDLGGGTSYSIEGVCQLLSVPYALHAKTAESLSGEITESDPWFSASSAASINPTDLSNLGNLSGINTGDQDISGIAVNTQAIKDTASALRAEMPDVSGFISNESDPLYSGSEAANITETDITNLGNLSGINTGDQDISGIAVNTQAIKDSANAIRADMFVGDMNYQNITNLADPDNDQDAATKAYVDVLRNEVNLLKLALENNAASSSISDLLSAGVTVSELLEVGQTVAELLEAGVAASEMKGLFYQGGIIFDLDESTGTGLICAVSDQNGGGETTWVNATAICNGLTLNGFDDWYLPSLTELGTVHANKDLINSAAALNGGSNFQWAGPYWSSTLMGSSYAWYKFFDDGSQNTGLLSESHNIHFLRAIRKF